MITYRDMTFCSYWDKCQRGNDCPRALTNNVAEEASKAEMNVCVFVTLPNCFYPKNELPGDKEIRKDHE
jgi:hypothetical protein